ncbi:MAG: hypothetical protein ABH828_04875 [archaeon]
MKREEEAKKLIDILKSDAPYYQKRFDQLILFSKARFDSGDEYKAREIAVCAETELKNQFKTDFKQRTESNQIQFFENYIKFMSLAKEINYHTQYFAEIEERVVKVGKMKLTIIAPKIYLPYEA